MTIIQFSNGTKVNFNGNPTPEDVDFVAKQVGITPQTQSQQTQNTPTVNPEREALKAQGQPVSVNPQKAEPSFGGKILRGLGKFGLGLASTVVPPIKAAMGDQDPYAPIKSGYLGDVYSPGGKALRELTTSQNLTPGKVLGLAGKATLDIAGKGAELASYGVGGGGAVEAGGQLLKGTAKQAIKTGAEEGLISGLVGGAGTGAQDAAENAQTIGQGIGKIAGSTALGGVTGLALGAGVPAIGAGISKIPELKNIPSKLIPQTAKENVARVLKNTGPKTISQIGSAKALDDAVNAFDIIRQNAPNIKVKDINDIEKPFEPSKATFFELPQALKQTKDAIYNEYSNIAKQAGETGLTLGKKDFTTLDGVLSKYEGKGYTPAFSAKAKQFKQALSRFNGKATPEEIQNLIEQVNLDVNPLSDKAGAQVANDFSSELRKTLDDKLEKNGNPLYQATRDKYAQLKSIEKDVIARYKEALRKTHAPPSIIDGIASLDAIMGVIKSEPTNIIRGGVIEALKKAYNYLRDPEVNLQRTFKILENQSSKSLPVNQAIQTTNKTITTNPIPKIKPPKKTIVNPIVTKAVEKLPTKSIGKIRDFGIQPGFVNPKVATGVAGIGTIGALALGGKKKTNYEQKESPIKSLTPNKLGHVLSQLESSGGRNKAKADKGEMKWVTGLTKLAIAELKRTGIKNHVDINDKNDVIDASVKYFNLLQKRHPNLSPAEVYVDYYWTQAKSPEDRKRRIEDFNNIANT